MALNDDNLLGLLSHIATAGNISVSKLAADQYTFRIDEEAKETSHPFAIKFGFNDSKVRITIYLNPLRKKEPENRINGVRLNLTQRGEETMFTDSHGYTWRTDTPPTSKRSLMGSVYLEKGAIIFVEDGDRPVIFTLVSSTTS